VKRAGPARRDGGSDGARTPLSANRPALAGIDLRIEGGRVVSACSAPTAAGKTTFIPPAHRLIWCRSSGSVTVDGFEPIADARAVHERIGFRRRDVAALPGIARARLPALSRAACAGLSGAPLARRRSTARSRALRSRTSRCARSANPLEGLQQRVNLAQAFLHDPALLIVDEPTGGLDPLQQADVRRELHGAAGETHAAALYPRPSAKHANSPAAWRCLSRGRLVACGPTAEILGAGDLLALFRGPEGGGVERALRALVRKEAGGALRFAGGVAHAGAIGLVTALLFFDHLRIYNQILLSCFASSTMGGFESDTVPAYVNLPRPGLPCR